MQKAERIGLIMEQIVQGYTMAEAARELGMHRQQLYHFCKENGFEIHQASERANNVKELPLELKDIHKNLVDTLNEKYTQLDKKRQSVECKKTIL